MRQSDEKRLSRWSRSEEGGRLSRSLIGLRCSLSAGRLASVRFVRVRQSLCFRNIYKTLASQNMKAQTLTDNKMKMWFQVYRSQEGPRSQSFFFFFFVFFLTPLSQEHKLIILLSRDNKARFPAIMDSFTWLSWGNKRPMSRDKQTTHS